MVLCATCKRRVSWTRDGRVTCTAGHMMMYRSRLPAQKCGTPFDGRLAELIVDETALYRFIEVDDSDAGAPEKWPTHNGVAQPPSAAKRTVQEATAEGGCATQTGGR